MIGFVRRVWLALVLALVWLPITGYAGDLIEYRATYTNQVQRNLSMVLAKRPIPAGMVYAPADITPKPVLASLDGTRFEPVPIKRMVRNSDRTKALKEVPIEEYHALR